MGSKITFLFLLFIIFFGSFLRLANLNGNPNGLYVDEASPAVNARLIAQTGKDEYGKEYPLSFRFLGSYTPPLYTYVTSLISHNGEPSIFIARLTSAISGILLIIVIFIFTKVFGMNNITSLFTTFIFTISPGAIFYSRIGYEINLGFLLYSLGCLFLYLSLNNQKFLSLGFGILALSIYAYHTQKLLVPFTIILFLLIFRKKFFSKKIVKNLLFSFILFVLFILPQIFIFFTPANTSRGVGLFYKEAIFQQASLMNIPILVSVPISFLREFTSQYFAYFSPRNLFFQPDSDLQRSLPELSIFYPWMVILYLVGIFVLIKQAKLNKGKFTVMLFLLAPIPASLTGDPFATQRALILILPLILIMAYGLQYLPKKGLVLVFLLSIFSMISLYRSLAVLLPNERAKIWGYGFSQLAEEIKKRPDEKFLIDSGRIKPAYIILAFFLKIPPEKLQLAADPNIKNDYYNNTLWNDHYIITNFETRSISWEEDIYKDQILVGDELAISQAQAKEHFLTKLFEIKSPNKEIIFLGFKTNPELKCKSSFDSKRC